MTDRIIITLPYNGAKSISINHIRIGGNMAWKLTPEAMATKTEIIWLVKNALQFTTWIPKAPLVVTISGWFKDRRSAIDLHNAIKLVMDALEVGIKASCPPGVNDKDMAATFKESIYGVPHPRIEIIVEQGGERG